MNSFKQYISEMVGIKKYYGAESVGDVVRDLGWKQLGSGAFASAWEVPGKKYVVKLWTLDSAYESFLKYIIRHPNPHYPKVLGRVKKIPAFYNRGTKEEVIKVVKLEKLKSIESYDSYEMVDQVSSLVERGVEKTSNYLQIIFAKHPQAESLYDALKEVEPYMHGEFDLYMGNFMQRKDGTIVITDPFYDADEMKEIKNRYLLPKEYSKPHYLERELDVAV